MKKTCLFLFLFLLSAWAVSAAEKDGLDWRKPQGGKLPESAAAPSGQLPPNAAILQPQPAAPPAMRPGGVAPEPKMAAKPPRRPQPITPDEMPGPEKLAKTADEAKKPPFKYEIDPNAPKNAKEGDRWVPGEGLNPKSGEKDSLKDKSDDAVPNLDEIAPAVEEQKS